MAERLDSVTVGVGGVSSATFSSISQSYTDLMVVGIVKTTGTAGTRDFWTYRINGLSTSIYDAQGTYIVGQTPSWVQYATNTTSAASMILSGYEVPTSNAGNDEIFAKFAISIANYTSATYNKIAFTEVAWWNGNSATAVDGNLTIQSFTHSIRTASAITSLVFSVNGGNLAENTQINLYGL